MAASAPSVVVVQPPRPGAFLIEIRDAAATIAVTPVWLMPSTRTRRLRAAYMRRHNITSFGKRRLLFRGVDVCLSRTCRDAGLAHGTVVTLRAP